MICLTLLNCCVFFTWFILIWPIKCYWPFKILQFPQKGWRKCLIQIQTMTYLSQVFPKTALKHTKTVRVIHLKQQITLPAITGFSNNYKFIWAVIWAKHWFVWVAEDWLCSCVHIDWGSGLTTGGEREMEVNKRYIAEATMRYLQSGYPGVLNLFDFMKQQAC